MPKRDNPAGEPQEWLPLGKAAAMLGVHSMTLRRWSDTGRFPSYRTAGGHRRFARSDVKAYLAKSRRQPAAALSNAWAEAALAQTRELVAHRPEGSWLQAIDAHDLRPEYRQLGQRLMGLLLQYVAADETNGTFLDEARRIGRRYGLFGQRAGLPLTTIMEAILFFRDILVESSLQATGAARVEPAASLRLLRRLNQVVNTVQLAVTEYYERRAGSGDPRFSD
ncbi:MAG: helix-turn-helix domain-containing protein [Candidatus Promineifilaceae bacterium]